MKSAYGLHRDHSPAWELNLLNKNFFNSVKFLRHGLIEHPDEQRFLMPETNLDNSTMLKDDENWTEGSEGSQKLGYDNKYLLKRLEKEKLFKKDWVLAYHTRLEASEKMKNLEFHSANIIQMPSSNSFEIEE